MTSYDDIFDALIAQERVVGKRGRIPYWALNQHQYAGGAGAETKGQSDALSRGVCTQQPTPRFGDAGAARPG